MKLNVSVESDILTVAGDASKDISIPGGTSVELPFLFEAREKGEGEIRFTILSDVLNEVLVEEVTVEQPIVKEAFTTIGIITADAPVSEALVIPGTSAEGYGGLSLAVDSTLYPYIQASLDDILETPKAVPSTVTAAVIIITHLRRRRISKYDLSSIESSLSRK